MDGTIINPLTQQPIDDSDLKSLSELVTEQLNLEKEVAETEAKLESLKSQLNAVSQKKIPDKLDSLGLSEIKTADGHKVSVKPFYSTKILSDRAFKWLDEQGHGGIITTVVQRKFTRDDRESAIEFQANNPGFELKESIHHQTLSSFTREVYENNEQLPEDLFQVFQGAKTKIS